MKRIEVKLALPAVEPLIGVIRELAEGMQKNPAAPVGLKDIDQDFRDAWAGELLEVQNEEVRALLAIFDGAFFVDGVVAFDEKNAETIVRACAAVRLRLREVRLSSLGDETLEGGDIDLATLEEPLRRAFMCYLFLATIQEIIIQQLDESILGG